MDLPIPIRPNTNDARHVRPKYNLSVAYDVCPEPPKSPHPSCIQWKMMNSEQIRCVTRIQSGYFTIIQLPKRRTPLESQCAQP
jgi:hypothetical protein